MEELPFMRVLLEPFDIDGPSGDRAAVHKQLKYNKLCFNIGQQSGGTCDVADRRNDPPLLKMCVGLRVHHQQPGLISAFLDEGHHVRVPHSLDVCAIDLKYTPRHDKGCLRKGQELDFWRC